MSSGTLPEWDCWPRGRSVRSFSCGPGPQATATATPSHALTARAGVPVSPGPRQPLLCCGRFPGRVPALTLTRCARAQPAPRTPTAREAVAALSEEPATAGSSRCFPPSRGARASPESARPRCHRETSLGVCPSHRPSCGIDGRGEGGLWAASSRADQAAPGPVCLPCGSSTRLLPQQPSRHPPLCVRGVPGRVHVAGGHTARTCASEGAGLTSHPLSDCRVV